MSNSFFFQIEDAEQKIKQLKERQEAWIKNHEARAAREATLKQLREDGLLEDWQLAKLESELDAPDEEGLSQAIRQQELIVEELKERQANTDKSLFIDAAEAEKLEVFESNIQEITLEVAQHLGDNMVRTICLGPTDGFARGAEVVDTGAPITVSLAS